MLDGCGQANKGLPIAILTLYNASLDFYNTSFGLNKARSELDNGKAVFSIQRSGFYNACLPIYNTSSEWYNADLEIYNASMEFYN